MRGLHMKKIVTNMKKIVKDNLKKLMLDLLLFSLTFIGLIGLDDSLKRSYFISLIILFLVMELFFALLQSNWVNALVSQCVIWCGFLLLRPIITENSVNFMCVMLELIWMIHITCLILSSFKKNSVMKKCTRYIQGYSILHANFNRYGLIPTFFVAHFLQLLYDDKSLTSFLIIIEVQIVEVALVMLYFCLLWMQKKSLMKYANHKNIIFFNVKYLTTPYRMFNFENFFLLKAGRSYEFLSFKFLDILGGVSYDDYYISQYTAINSGENTSKKYCMIVRVDSSKYYSKNALKKITEWLSFQEEKGATIFIEDASKKANYKNESTISVLLKAKYPYYYREKTTIFGNGCDLIIESELKNRNNVKLNDIQNTFKACHELMEHIDSGKIKYFSPYKNTLKGLNKTFLQDFYNLILIAEYMIHYEALMVLSGSNMSDVDKSIMVNPSLGDYVNVINGEKKYSKESYADIINSARFLDSVAVRNGKSNIKTKAISKKQILEVVCKVRNRFLGHGTIIYAVSGEMVQALGQLVRLLLDEFSQLEDKQSLIDKDVLQTSNTPCLYKKHTVLFNGVDQSGYCAYLDYATGYTIYPDEQRNESEISTIPTLRFIE